jgi:hypothetical protein
VNIRRRAEGLASLVTDLRADGGTGNAHQRQQVIHRSRPADDRPTRREKVVIVPEGGESSMPPRTRVDDAMIKAVARAYGSESAIRWRANMNLQPAPLYLGYLAINGGRQAQ